jgi:hypothetical protein
VAQNHQGSQHVGDHKGGSQNAKCDGRLRQSTRQLMTTRVPDFSLRFVDTRLTMA